MNSTKRSRKSRAAKAKRYIGQIRLDTNIEDKEDRAKATKVFQKKLTSYEKRNKLVNKDED